MTDTSDAQLQLKKRARRRLVGAVAFAGLAAIVLPMVMDAEPKMPAQEVQIRIPSLDQPPLDSGKLAPAVPLAPAAPAQPPAAVPPPVAAAAPSQPPAADNLPARAPDKTNEKISEKANDKPAGKADAAAEKALADKLAAEKAAAEKAAARPVAREAVKDAGKDAAKAAARAPEKAAENKGAEKASDKQADDARRAAAILGGKAAPAPAAADGAHVILIGAFANPANVRQLQSKLGELSIKTYTEALESPQGTKTRLRAGPFASRDAAEKALERMKRIGVSGVVAAKQ